jgi:hypothetical protein
MWPMARVTVDLSDVFTIHHFVREFQGSVRIARHFYLIQRKVKRVQKLLARAGLPLPEIEPFAMRQLLVAK